MDTFEILGLTLYIEYKMSSNLIIWKLKIIVQNIFVWKLSVSFVQQYSILLEHTTLFYFSRMMCYPSSAGMFWMFYIC